jgi:hypothetical protein
MNISVVLAKNHRQSQAHYPKHQNAFNNIHDIHIKVPFILDYSSIAQLAFFVKLKNTHILRYI